MIKGIENNSESFLADIARIQRRQARVQREISSGLKVSMPSHAPERVTNILELRSDVERSNVIAGNLQRVQAETNASESALQQAVQVVERARVLGVQAAGWNTTARKTVGIEVRQLHDQLVNLTRTVSEGKYVFSGDLDSTVLYTSDWSQPSGVVRNATAENTRAVVDVNGTTFVASRSAHQIFDDPNSNVFSAVHDLGVALEADDRAAVEATLPKIVGALDHLNTQLSFYGVTQQRVQASIDTTQKVMLLRKEELSSLQDTDIAEALVEFNMARVHHEAALGARAKMATSSLFDYLG